VTAENFKEKVLLSHDAKHIILEVFKEHCGACSFNKPVF
jgi:thioredoxin-like negative regulator of GroEL